MDKVHAIIDRASAKRLQQKELLETAKSDVQGFYNDAVVFVTGWSGFVGKQLVEKLFRTSNIKKMYVLVRSKKGKNIEERVKTILEDPVYDLLRSQKPEFVGRLVAVEGDVSQLKLGIDENTWCALAKEVNIIFHAAATISFGETIKSATLTHVRGTREMLYLARACEQLKSVVYVSTAFSHATKSRISKEVLEDVYECPIPPEALIQLAENLNDDNLNSMIEPIMSDWPNNYTFTKAVTEYLVMELAKNLPLCIVRPAVVISAFQEPTPGWIDIRNAYGPTGVIIGVGLGIIHTFLLRQDVNFDSVPVDIVNNAMIVAARETFTRFSENNKRTIIYTVTNGRNPLYHREILAFYEKEARQIPTAQAVWYCFGIDTRFEWLYILLTWLLHFIPAYIVDGCCLILGKKPRLLEIYKKIKALSSVFIYFAINYWKFNDKNTLELYNKLSDIDKQIYNFDMESVDKSDLLFTWLAGIRLYIVKDGLKDTDYAIKKQFWLKIATYIFFPIYFYLLFYLTRFVFLCMYYVFCFLSNKLL